MWRDAYARKSPDLLGTLICCGVMTFFAFPKVSVSRNDTRDNAHTGIPIPFVSYGGSSAISCFVGIGLVLTTYASISGFLIP
ncbi:MAG: hypothetical protein Ct9H90mP11_06840 [Acidimicrobiales bacterium]|nr:MAG: hypothetical protein Ct9H90mP11_06840 [Acidimicrobiales bacterium]